MCWLEIQGFTQNYSSASILSKKPLDIVTLESIKLMIDDDEASIAEDIADFCEDIGFPYPPVFVSYRAGQTIDYLKNNPVDLGLLDINLEDDIDGIEIADYINLNRKADFIFLTSYSDPKTLTKASSTNPAGYITKPLTKEQLLNIIIQAINNLKSAGGAQISKSTRSIPCCKYFRM